MIARRVSAAMAAAVLVLVALLGSPAPASASHLIGGHWAHDGLAHSQIYFVDHTGVNWPVTTSTYKWNEARGVDSYYVSSCPSSRLHCVNVIEYNDPNDGMYGYVFYAPYNSAGHYTTSNTVHLNNGTDVSAAQRRSTTCQEQGHILGLDHRASGATCMIQYINPTYPQVPDSHDFSTLQSLYAHAN